MLEIDRISKRFKGLKALDEVTLTVGAGEIRGIVGPNGSGKTTLFNVVSRIYAPTGGTVRLFGARIARTFQNLRLFGGMSVLDNVLVALDQTRTRWAWRYLLWPVGVWRADRRLRGEANDLLDRYGLATFAHAMPGSLPYGVQRRVEIARAMAVRPRLLLLDEPAAGLNGDEVRQLAAIVRDIRAGGVTVVLIEHNMELVMSLCDRVTVLDLGKVIADGSATEVANHPRVIEAYLGRSGEAQEVELTSEAVQ